MYINEQKKYQACNDINNVNMQDIK